MPILLPTELVQYIGRLRAERLRWMAVAMRLNRERVRRVGQVHPWTVHMAEMTYYRTRGDAWYAQSLARDRRRRQLRAIVRRLYLEHRDEDDRVQRVLSALSDRGIVSLAGGQLITRQWVVWLMGIEGVRVSARAWLRPRLRADCQGGPRPCPWVTCRHHLVPHLVASAERSYRNQDNRSVPAALAPTLAAGDFRALEHTCILDILDARGVVDAGAALVDAAPDGSAIGRTLGITRELVRLDVRKAIGKVKATLPEVAAFLQRGYDVSKLGGDR
ncbi:MAG: hypothetical protein MUF10_11210 [Thermoanaerobaculaceae bacterium]|jgi:hypothetical protein|nr:hypothetical protein [Thermoanaerobaculaceae bacterium]